MKEWTEQEEQEMIARAKAGDPEANYALSLWALSRGEEEPDEPRWNRLAAKCLVKAAQAGYGPALEQMEGILHPDAAPKTAPRPAAPQKAAPAAPISINDARQNAARRAPVHQTTARRPQSRPAPGPEDDGYDEDEDYDDEDEDEDEDYDEFDEDDEYDDEPSPRRKSAGRGRPSSGRAAKKSARPKKSAGRDGRAPKKKEKAARSSDGGGKWGDAQWRRLEIICVAVCAVLLVFIAVMIFTGRRGTAGSGSGTSAIPPAGDAATVQSSGGDATPAPASEYPDQATKDAIMAADLAIQPEEEDYMTAPTTATVSVSSQYLRLRKGPNTTYDPIAEMPNDTIVDVYATKNDWDLVLFNGDDGPIYGWCSSEYLIITAGAAGPAASAGSSEG